MGQSSIICVPCCSGLRNNTKSSIRITSNRKNRNWASPKHGCTNKEVVFNVMMGAFPLIRRCVWVLLSAQLSR